MRILFDLNHPAHVHLFKFPIQMLRDRGHTVFITARDKDLTRNLLDALSFSYQKTTKQRRGLFGGLLEMLEMDFKVFNQIRAHKIELIVGTSIAAAHTALLSRGRSVIFNEDDRLANPQFPAITYPFATFIVTPSSLPEDYGGKHHRYEGYQELAYLHPKRFTPNDAILKDLGLAEGEFFSIMRFVALQAAHDTGARGLSMDAKRRLLEILEAKGPVFITSEKPLPPEFEPKRLPIAPEKMHDLLAFAGFYVGDSQSMTAEAAILGTPAIRSNSFVRRISYLDELEDKYQLTFAFRPSEAAEMLEKVESLLAMPDLQTTWTKRRKAMLTEKVDVSQWIVDFLEEIA